MKNRGENFIEEQLNIANQTYFQIKAAHTELNQTTLDNFALAISIDSGSDKQIILKQLRERQQQRIPQKRSNIYKGK